ncbi:MAG: efflux RND transporter periplasmic adaptor subunit [Chloroflexi bacterium]|nr:efflux RND transporter periplasmic adaptor subunit [Chloroflexota bacterium]
MRKRNAWLVSLVVLLLIGGGGYAMYARYYSSSLAMSDEPPEPTLETATVTRGDIVLIADGTGELVPAAELELTFRTGGVLDEVLVEIGDQVNKDDLLARLETDKLERVVAEADVELELARLDLADVREGASDADLDDAQAALRDAQVELSLAYAAYEDVSDSNLDAIVDSRKADFDWWVGYYQSQKAEYEEGDLSQIDHDWAMAAMIAAEGRWDAAINQARAEETQTWSRVTQAQNAVYQAEENLKLLESGPLTDTLVRAELDVDQALMAQEKALANLEKAQLYASFDGVVMDVSATAGEQVGTNIPILTLADLQEPLLRFWVEETDMSSVVVGNPIHVIFEALPDDVFGGEIVRVDPVLVTVDGTSAVQVLGRLDLGDRTINLLAGMTAEVEVVAAEARGAILVPVEALRETLPGNYAVFVVKPNGEPEMRAITIGLQDVINAEVLTGLKVGETVSVGETQ